MKKNLNFRVIPKMINQNHKKKLLMEKKMDLDQEEEIKIKNGLK